MRLMGIAVKLETEGRPTARAILIEPGTPNPLIVDSFALTGDDVDFTRQLFELSQATRSRSAALKPTRIVIARADFPPTGTRKEGRKLRLLAEGAIAAAARETVTVTALATGHEIGQWDGTSKDDVKARAKGMLRAAGLPQKWLEATMAAIGALAYSP